MSLPNGLISYGPNANCTLDLCPIQYSLYQYRPSLPVNAVFAGLFGLAFILHVAMSISYREWGFMTCMALGCIDEAVGYGGRIMMYQNPFSFTGFLMQIICITTGPVFFCAAIYVLLARIVTHLDPSLSRFRPQLFYYIFIPCDILSLVLQSAGGATSSTSSDNGATSQTNPLGVDLSLAGLAFQVFTLCCFIALCVDYMYRYSKSANRAPLSPRFKIFLGALGLAIILILARCAYRIDELSDGYTGPLIKNQWLFVGLESVLITVAVLVMLLAHPGPVFQRRKMGQAAVGGRAKKLSSDSDMSDDAEMLDTRREYF